MEKPVSKKPDLEELKTELEGAVDFRPKLVKAHWSKTVIPERPPVKCDHYFEFVGGQAACTRCPLRLMGVLKIEDGKPIL